VYTERARFLPLPSAVDAAAMTAPLRAALLADAPDDAFAQARRTLTVACAAPYGMLC
jgi:hypothetical protein